MAGGSTDRIEDLKSRVQQLTAQLNSLQEDHLKILSFISHDIKGPINRIFALMELMRHESPELETKLGTYFGKISIVIADTKLMIQNLTDYRNLQYNRIALNVVLIPAKGLGKVVSQYTQLGEKKGVSVTGTIETDESIETDNYLFNRIIDNLLSNAVKFTAPGKSVHYLITDDGVSIRIAVTDEAHGFRQEELGKLFSTPFLKLSVTPTAGENTTGLGLYVSKCFADLLGAGLECTTTEGIGSTFALKVPKSFPYSKR